MRVIAGKYRSRRLKGPGKLRLRPTSDRLRETLFNILGPSVEDSLFVDLYAGTGAIGIEAIRIRTGVDVIEADAVKGLKNLAARHLVADFISLDPPYEGEEHLRVLEF